ncbi:acyl-CoA ligase (AMP-forming), exosortase A system-associated [Streptomyces sp. DSM 44915]|uniref:Acyl-CoA ligase (AMP-forming), exosortase A system-associated n=1 Tax=Streptomyces chisholmiae TaxID=3075540 RepID=A0ABU2JQR9_9ACTN|nr:acyl-CoA ligase (AMP-forming), exosortase A system-associated [Streptomyces sp. DSM 44915]MDT0267331.1 acyl-CoA ligase (AMP-forming), exosortase A system-associated [Streptomyces sp. DSM 44915]
MPERPPLRVDQLLDRGEPDRPALTYRDETLTYARLADQVSRVAAGLRAAGVGRGDRIAVYAEKRLETVVTLLAAAAAGAVFVPLNPLFRAGQVRQVVADCAPRLLVTTGERRATVEAALADAVDGPAAATEPPPRVVAFGTPEWGRWLAAEPLDRHAPGPVIDQDPAAILYTSGSTGGPKGVLLSHANLLAGAASVAGYLRHTPDDVLLGALPLSFDAGLSQLTTALVAGAHLVLANYLRPAQLVRLCARHRVTGLTCVPPLWLRLAAERWPAEATTALRYFANTGGRLPRATLDTLRRIFPAAEPYLMYGLTEAFRSTYLDPAQVDRRPDSIGKAVPNAEILLVRPDGTACEPGEHGELVHRGALVALGYWRDPERTARRFRPLPGEPLAGRPETAVWSGDIAYRDEEGYLYFVGRDDDLIKTSGYRVSPTEVEEAAYASGLVGEAVAFGVPDEELGQRIVLLVAATDDGPGPSVPELRGALAATLPAYMVPAHIEVRAELPRSVNGKFDRAALRRTVRATPPASQEVPC